MAESKALTPVSEADYEAIEAAVMETARGRWFLAEYARRNRNADTVVLLDAIERLEGAVARDRASEDIERLRLDLGAMADAIARAKQEIASIRPHEGSNSDLFVASEALDGIVRTTEKATSDILEAAEHVQEAAWTLREEGGDEALCDELDRRATDIYTACSFQDLTAQRTSRIVDTLRFLESRINAMMTIWGAEGPSAAEPPVRSDLSRKLDVFAGLNQDAVDVVIVEPLQPENPSARLREPFRQNEGEVVFLNPSAAEASAYFDVPEDATSAAPPASPVAVAAPEPPPLVDTALLDDLAWEDVTIAESTCDLQAGGAEEMREEAARPAAATAAPLPDDEQADDEDPFAEFDMLPVREKLRRFS